MKKKLVKTQVHENRNAPSEIISSHCVNVDIWAGPRACESIVPYFLTEKFDEKLIAKPFRIFRGRLKFKRATADLVSKTQYIEKE